ncbi:hypothetical protein [Mammaliicoccus sciuri]|uniref:hypothetical protein n=1 Tax=Mammaliicoccus sciuri TaxID=1296 RepID=UPI001C3C4A5E|nr:hypothetical protein [Mammaliicoccus sciuri]MBV5103415.1 hypothetical protein [Mammaliicoccus sciuri]
MITKISDEKSCFEVGKNGVGAITEWRVNIDVVDIYRVSDINGHLLAFKGFINKKYKVEHEEKVKKQLSIFDI